MTNQEAISYLCNLRVAIGRTEHQALWHYEQALAEIIDMLSEQTHDKRTETHACVCERTETHAEPEPLTDREQRIFLAAMGREEKVCKQIDEECMDCREPYEDSLVWICHEITRKVKGALWTI